MRRGDSSRWVLFSRIRSNRFKMSARKHTSACARMPSSNCWPLTCAGLSLPDLLLALELHLESKKELE